MIEHLRDSKRSLSPKFVVAAKVNIAFGLNNAGLLT
jgi:hypothetical protein